MFSLICVWINGWVNNSEAGDLRRHRGHYDVTVMDFIIIIAVLIESCTKNPVNHPSTMSDIYSMTAIDWRLNIIRISLKPISWTGHWDQTARLSFGAIMTLSWHGNVLRMTGPLWGDVHPWPMDSLARDRKCVVLMLSLLFARTNSRVAGDLRRHGVHAYVVFLDTRWRWWWWWWWRWQRWWWWWGWRLMYFLVSFLTTIFIFFQIPGVTSDPGNWGCLAITPASSGPLYRHGKSWLIVHQGWF